MIVEVSMSSIDCSDSFFDSFRGFYPKFDNWFARQSDAGRHAFIHRDSEGSLDGFLCLKIEGPVEDYSDLEKPFEPGVRLKINFWINFWINPWIYFWIYRRVNGSMG